MKSTIKKVEEFLKVIDFSQFAQVDKISFKEDEVSISLADTFDDLPQVAEEWARVFNFEYSEISIYDGEVKKFLVNVPNKGCFGFISTYSKHYEYDDYSFVIYNNKYAIADKNGHLTTI